MAPVVCLVVLCGGVPACSKSPSGSSGSSGTTTSSGGSPLTNDQADRLAEVLLKNHDSGGAKLHAEVPFGVGGFTLDGQIDWANHVGRVTVTAKVDGAARPPVDLVFNPNVVFEEVPGLAERLTATGKPAAHWVARALDPAKVPLHVVLRLIETSASTVRDNPQLLAQSDARYLGQEAVGSLTTDHFQKGKVRIWVGPDGRSVRMSTDLAATRSVATVNYSDFGPRVVPVPNDADIVSLESVADIYNELTRAGG
jgi:hypothetical protein